MKEPLRQIFADRRLAYYYAQKGLRSVGLRERLGGAMAGWARWRGGEPPQLNPLAERLANDLTQTGFAALPEKTLSAEAVAAVRAQLEPKPLLDYYDASIEYRWHSLPRHVLKMSYRKEDVAACRTLTDLANDPDILAAVAARLGAKPTLASLESWWTLGEHNTEGVKAFDDIYHRDVDDLRFVKLFLYLTDTDLDSGAHRFVLGSHADAHYVKRGPISDEQVEQSYPDECIKTITASAGTLFLEETWGIHRALLATRGRRLIFSAIYPVAALLPNSPRRPMLPLPAGYDPYINRLLFR